MEITLQFNPISVKLSVSCNTAEEAKEKLISQYEFLNNTIQSIQPSGQTYTVQCTLAQEKLMQIQSAFNQISLSQFYKKELNRINLENTQLQSKLTHSDRPYTAKKVVDKTVIKVLKFIGFKKTSTSYKMK